MELKTQLESVLWGLWMLDEERQWRGTFEDFVRFYAKEGNIRFGLFEIASLLPFPLSCRHFGQDRPPAHTIRQ
jgi:hypothetical protein